ncbi:hypothetical protein [Lederbergia galactosidilytica]|uniref:Uncharacterized protein n=1 Tax=Lederbergia galactosidilytica TaxID=217031 RepID=A0A178A5M8_9BACI|nr:hypothetical protein [Lederbergia galactosidilytica]OAK75495.1 hypothetical protein ABB05_01965 [Lederbergia galactosidilytica]
MKKSVSNEVKRGQAISFRIPSDTPDHLLKHLQRLKETERRNFSSKMAEFVMQGVGQSLSREKEVLSIPLPQKLTKAQRNWLKHEHSEALLGSIIYQLLNDPARAASLLASLNSHSLNLDDALYLQEEMTMDKSKVGEENVETNSPSLEKPTSPSESHMFDDDLDSFQLEGVREDHSAEMEEKEDSSDNDLESLLGDFLAEMNK